MKNNQHSSFFLLDLPESVILRICANLARCTLFAAPNRPYQELPYDLLSLASTCHSLRCLVRGTCDSLSFDPYSSWRPIVSWLRFASPQLRSVRVSPLPAQLDFPLRHHQLLPPFVVLSSLHFHQFPLRFLDLSGLNLFHEHDALLLATVLSRLHRTLTTLVLLDARSAFRSIVRAVVDAHLENLTSFTYLSLRAGCRQEIVDILTSFHSKCQIESTNDLVQDSSLQQCAYSRLTHLHLHVQESTERSCLSHDSILSGICPNVTDFVFESEFESPQVVPQTFIYTFRNLRVLTLKNLMLDQLVVDNILSELPDLTEIQLDGCLVLHDEETMLHATSEPFLDVISACTPVLTSLWLPARYFSIHELYHLIDKPPRLKALALTVAQSTLSILPELCKAFSGTLENFRLSVLADDGTITSIPIDLQLHILRAVQCAPHLTSLHFMSAYLKMDIVRDMLKYLSSQLTIFFIEINPNDKPEIQFQDTIDLLEAVVMYSSGLNFFCMENENPYELPYGSEKAKKLRNCVDRVLQSAAVLSSTNLHSLLENSVLHQEENKREDVESVADDERNHSS